MATLNTIRIADIDRSGRYRKDIGELIALCKSIGAVGLLHPIVVTADNKLIAGERRIAAYERLGKTEIAATIVNNLDEATLLLRAEQDENTCRKDFTPTEAAKLGMALEPLAKENANARKREGQSQGGKSRHGVSLPENLRQAEKSQVREKVGAAVGMSGPTYHRAKAVTLAAEQDPETFGPIAAEMDRSGKVLPAYEKMNAIKRSGTRATVTTTNGRTPVGVLRANEAINCLKRIPKNDAHRARGFQIVLDYVRHNK